MIGSKICQDRDLGTEPGGSQHFQLKTAELQNHDVICGDLRQAFQQTNPDVTSQPDLCCRTRMIGVSMAWIRLCVKQQVVNQSGRC